MTKKLVLALTVALVIAFAVPAYAAMTDGQKKEVLELQKQMAALRKQVVQRYVDSGEITKEQGKTIQENIDQRMDYLAKNPDAIGPIGGGCGGGQFGGGQFGGQRGRGMMGGRLGGGPGGQLGNSFGGGFGGSYQPSGNIQGI
ncbi:MAG: YckD family protein [Carboxydocellales bacterium]